MTANLDTKIDWYSDETAAQGRGYSDLLSNTNIKSVIIALPILSQPKFIKEALEAGKHVLSEKPVAKDCEEGRRLWQWFETEGKHHRGSWSVAENWRWLDSHDFAAKKVQELGRVLGFRVRVHSFVKPGTKYFGKWP